MTNIEWGDARYTCVELDDAGRAAEGEDDASLGSMSVSSSYNGDDGTHQNDIRECEQEERPGIMSASH